MPVCRCQYLSTIEVIAVDGVVASLLQREIIGVMRTSVVDTSTSGNVMCVCVFLDSPPPPFSIEVVVVRYLLH